MKDPQHPPRKKRLTRVSRPDVQKALGEWIGRNPPRHPLDEWAEELVTGVEEWPLWQPSVPPRGRTLMEVFADDERSQDGPERDGG